MMKTKIVAISDIHGELLKDLPSGDILTISGDICPVKGSHHPVTQQYWITGYFLPWCRNLIETKQFKNIVFIAGNHDFVFQKYLKTHSDVLSSDDKNIYFLNDSEITVDGIRIYGTPWTTKFGNWAFMNIEDVLDNHFSKIPEGLDILLCHGPMKDYNDTILQYPDRMAGRDTHVGSSALTKHVKRTKPKYLLVGHIHSGSHDIQKCYQSFDEKSFEHTQSINVSLMDEDYNIAYKPFVFFIEK